MLLIASMGTREERGRRSLAARLSMRSGLRRVSRELLLDHRAIALEPVLHLHELAALDGPDLHPATAFMVGGGDLHRWYEAAQGEALDRLHALLDLLRGRHGAALRLDGIAQRLDVDRRMQDTAVVVDGRVHLLRCGLALRLVHGL